MVLMTSFKVNELQREFQRFQSSSGQGLRIISPFQSSREVFTFTGQARVDDPGMFVKFIQQDGVRLGYMRCGRECFIQGAASDLLLSPCNLLRHVLWLCPDPLIRVQRGGG